MGGLLILGAGGMGRMMQETALQLGYEDIAFLDDAKKEKDVIGKCCDYENFLQKYDAAIAAFGDNNMRLFWTEKLMEAGYQVPTLIHPTAVVSPNATVGRGCFILQRAVVNRDTVMEHAVLINSGAIVDHDAYLSSGVHIGLGSVVKAYCTISSGTRTEAGEVIFSTHKKIDGVDDRNLEDAIYAFGFGPKCSYVKPFGAGHINETYAVYMPGEDGDELSYVLQRVNSNVFKDPSAVMENIFGVTEYLRGMIRVEGGNPDRETLCYIKTKTGCQYFEDAEGEPWRCYNFIPNSVCYQQVKEPEQFYQSGNSFGHFLKQLGDYPAERLNETIQDFHNTVKRYKAFEVAVKRDMKDRAAFCKPEIEFVKLRERDCGILVQQQETGELPLRVTHNDTKLNNILFDENTGEGICIIDLDTIMPGLAANDFGDAIRFGAATAAEDEKNLNLVHFDIELYEMFVKGYLEETKEVLTDAEIRSLAWGARLMTLECGIRFLTDYLKGDTYFRTAYPEHNLVRARTQFKMVAEMEQQFDKMQEIIEKYR